MASPLEPKHEPSKEQEARRFRGWRAWVLRLALVAISPIILHGLLELGLRASGYGYPTGFFVKQDKSGAYRTNEKFGRRFFPSALERAPVNCVLVPKPTGAVRIFVLGSSVAEGYPEPPFAFGRILEVMLRDRYPGVRFEVINAAMTAINSHVALEIARDCAAQQPDLFIVYMGNNEVIGPYGPGTIFQRWSSSRAVIRASILIKSTRVGQLTSDIVSRFRGGDSTPAKWGGMEMFLGNPVSAEDPRLNSVYANFKQNLVDICGVARSAGVPVVLSTVATNLNDCPPFGSEHRVDLSSADLQKWGALYRQGVIMDAAGKPGNALQKYEAAAQIDDRFAELQYRMARCFLAEGRAKDAHNHFALARDLDVLRFRADSRINQVIRDVAAAQQPNRVSLADAERALSDSRLATAGIPGEKLFYEHVHLTFDGNYELARAILDNVTDALPQLARFRSNAQIPSRDQCAASLALTPWDELRMAQAVAVMTAKPPFTNQSDYSVRQTGDWQRVATLSRLVATPDVTAAVKNTYENAISHSPDDWMLRLRFGQFAIERGQPDVAVEQWRHVAEAIPWAAGIRNQIGNALMQMGWLTDAAQLFEQALKLNPQNADSHYGLGCALIQQGKPAEALAHWREAIRLGTDNVSLPNDTAWLLATNPEAALRNGKEAVALATKANEISGGNDPAMLDTLAAAYAEAGRFPEAVSTAEKALAIAVASQQAALADELSARIKLYQSGSPFHEKPASAQK